MNPFKKKGKKFPTPAVPREEDEIKKEYFELRGRAGEIQYQIAVYTEELSKYNNKMRDLNHEAAARQTLNKEKQTKETKNEQV